jgi:hypothetical protein
MITSADIVTPLAILSQRLIARSLGVKGDRSVAPTHVAITLRVNAPPVRWNSTLHLKKVDLS